MKSLILIFFLILSVNVFANVCEQASKDAKELESIVSGVYHTSESDDFWTGFASSEPLKKITPEEMKRVIDLIPMDSRDDYYVANFRMENHKEAYKFMDYEIDSLVHYAMDDEEDDSPEKFHKLIDTIKEKYGENIRLIQYGDGDGDSHFVGDHMIIMIMENGCILGLKVFTVWT